MKDTNTSQEPDIIDRLRGLSVLVVGGIGLDAARCISGLRAELAEANADCKRANELINAAIEDYNEALEKAKLHAADAKTAWAECELLRSAIRKLGVKG